MNERIVTALFLCAALFTAGCKDDHKTGDGKTHDQKAPVGATGGGGTAKEGHANPVALGEKTVNGLKIKAIQDEPIKAGGEGAFDLAITGYPAGGKPKAVRFWVGVQSAEGSVKSRADEEGADNWHSHVEVPNPLPPGSKFWAEIEPATGAAVKVSFDLK